MGILMGMKYFLTLVLICIPLISDVKHRFIYLLAIYLYVFFGKLSIQVFCLIIIIFLIWLLQVLVAAHGIFFSCDMWDPIP